MFSCRRASHLISDQHERSLSRPERMSLGVHLLGCRPCRRFRRAVRWLDRTLASAAGDASLPIEARERIRLALEQAAREE
jgi:hypothetical protein